MTTAHRPTWDAAAGKKDVSAFSQSVSSKKVGQYQKLKFRKAGQDRPENVKRRDLRQELKDAEMRLLGSTSETKMIDDKPKDERTRVIEAVAQKEIDDKSQESHHSSSDSEDETAELMRELARIKKERAEEKARIEAQQSNQSALDFSKKAATANPLINLGMSTDNMVIKKKWHDDLIFTNQAQTEHKVQTQNFINDLQRSDFHKLFLKKFIA